MSKSKYPNKIDTSVEIPTIRDNITEIGSDVLNSYKSAILAIEKTLGVNPQGSAGNTVSSRIGRSLDSSGNILESAITRAGLISGPITDNEVSESAAVSERKLNLDFPTQLLQDEISMLQADIESFEESLKELSSKLAVHLSPAALNSHQAVSIGVTGVDPEPSDIASLSLDSGTLQRSLEEIYNSHINYTGLSISSTNNSHYANQIYFDNTEIQDLTTSDDLQNVIEDLASLSGDGFRGSLLNLNSNGILRKGNIYDGYEGLELPNTIIKDETATYTKVEGSSRTTFNLTSNPVLEYDINIGDILILSGALNEEDNRQYSISSFNISSSNELISVETFGGPKNEDSLASSISIHSNKYSFYNPTSLLSTVRPRNDKTNTPDIQVSNPNSATIISKNINPEFITETENTFNIVIDGGSSVTIETYDSNVINQTLDSIVNKINEQSIENNYNFMAYKYRAANCYELALIHNIPNITSDLKNRTLSVDVGSVNDGTTYLGFENILQDVFEGTSGNSVFVNGQVKSIFGNIAAYSNSEIGLVNGSGKITLSSGTFISAGHREGDIIFIDGSSDPNDDGSYRISSTLEDSAEIDGSYKFQGNLNDNSIVYIIRCTAPIGEITFEEVASSTGSVLFDVFMDENLDIFYKKRIELSGDLVSGAFIGSLLDVSKDFIIKDDTAEIKVLADGTAYLIGPNGNIGPSKYVASPGIYKLFSADGLSFITIRVGSSSIPLSSISVSLFGFDEIPSGSLILSRGNFSNSLGRVLGYPSEPGIPLLIDKRVSGTINEYNISSSLVERYIEGPRNELRASGIIRGIEVSNVQVFSGYQTFDVSGGVAFVNGIRIEFPGRENLRINTENDFYVAIDPYGCIITGESVNNPDGYTVDNQGNLSPFYDLVVAHLASIESQEIYDLRLFIDRLDYKITKDIIISPEENFGHFSSIGDGVEYAKRFTDMFPEAGTPNIYIREGLFEVTSQINIDFDVKISGSGSSTIIQKSGSFASGTELISGNPSPLNAVFNIGDPSSASDGNFQNGVTIKDLSYRTSDSLTNVGSFINISKAQVVNALFKIENIIAQGPSTIAYNGGGDSDVIGEYFAIIGAADQGTYDPEIRTYANIIIKNCIMNSMGVEFGPCLLRGPSLHFYIIASENIALGCSPNEGDTSFEIFDTTQGPSTTEVIEVSNIVTV